MAQQNTSPRDSVQKVWLQVARADAKGKIIDFTDPDPEPVLYDPKQDEHAPKFAVNYCAYAAEGTEFKSRASHRHWIDVDALDLLAWDLLTTRKGDKTDRGYTPLLDEFKGGRAGKNALGIAEDQVVSRRFTVAYMDTMNGEALRSGPVYQFSFIVCDGKLGDKGQVMPVQGGKQYLKESINVTVPVARKIGRTINRYLQAKLGVAILRHDFSPPAET